MNTSSNKQLKQSIKTKKPMPIKLDDDSSDEKIISMQIREREGKSPQGYVYIPLEFRRQLGWIKGQILSVQLNKGKDGIEIRTVAFT